MRPGFQPGTAKEMFSFGFRQKTAHRIAMGWKKELG